MGGKVFVFSFEATSVYYPDIVRNDNENIAGCRLSTPVESNFGGEIDQEARMLRGASPSN